MHPATNSVVPGDVKPLFWSSTRPDHLSAWHGHVSFAHWLVTHLRPSVIVELGTHNGVSFAAFCNSVEKNGLVTQCYAIDSWEGDTHAGHYGNEVFEDISRFTAERYPRSAVLLRSYFDAALARFAPQSIDLLHIDGLHTYEAVLNDFSTWLPKMSKRGVVLFHDTEIQGAGFGVWRLWAELCAKYPHFTFNHSAGLGVLAVGSDIAPALSDLFDLERTGAAPRVKAAFAVASSVAQEAGSVERKAAATRYLATIPNGRTNLALNRYTIQSSLEQASSPKAFGAVDGVRTGGFGFHTAFEESPWWMVDLGSEQPVDEIVVYNRLDSGCKSRSDRLEVSVSGDGANWQPLYRHEGAAFGGIDGEPLRITLDRAVARFVKMALLEPGFLHLDQVEVYSRR